MARRILLAALCALGLSTLLLTLGCGGSDLVYPGVAVYTINGTNISPSSTDITSSGTLQLHNSGATDQTVTFSSDLDSMVIPAESTVSKKVPSVTSLKTITITVTGGDAATLRIHP